MPDGLDEDEDEKLDRLKRNVRALYTALDRAGGRDPDVYWPAANDLTAYAVLRQRGGETIMTMRHEDPRVAFALREGVTMLEGMRGEYADEWPAVVEAMRLFHQGRMTAVLPKETATQVRAELDRLLKGCGPASFDEMLASVLQ